jgi:hypothetical protein
MVETVGFYQVVWFVLGTGRYLCKVYNYHDSRA